MTRKQTEKTQEEQHKHLPRAAAIMRAVHLDKYEKTNVNINVNINMYKYKYKYTYKQIKKNESGPP